VWLVGRCCSDQFDLCCLVRSRRIRVNVRRGGKCRYTVVVSNYVVSNTELGICYRDVSVHCLPVLPILAADPAPNQAKVAAPGSLFLGEAALFPGALL
jgi:hypothetical protein